MISQEAYTKFKQNYPLDSVKAAEIRDAAFLRLQANGLPSKKEEAWKYTSLTPLFQNSFEPQSTEVQLTHHQLNEIKALLKPDFTNIIFINGVLNTTLSDDFFEIGGLVDLQVEDFDYSQSITETKLMDLTYSQASEKLKLNIENSSLKSTDLFILFYQTNNKSQIICPQIQIELQKRASAKIILNFCGKSPFEVKHFINSSLRIKLNDFSNLECVQIQNNSIQDFQTSRVIFELGHEAQLKSLDLSLGASISRNYIETQFKGHNASAFIFGGLCLNQNQHSDHYTLTHHAVGSNQSVQKYKSILTEQSQSIFRGRVRIEPQAQKANSEQINNNLLLSEQAQAISVPQLEIYADDVKASHGATVGQISNDELFYLLSRGINKNEALKMLSMGFVLELVHLFESDKLKEIIKNAIQEKLNGMII